MIPDIEFMFTKQITDYWELLDTHNLQYHLDDDPEDILWCVPMDCTLLQTIIRNHNNLWSYCEESGISPWDYVEVNL